MRVYVHTCMFECMHITFCLTRQIVKKAVGQIQIKLSKPTVTQSLLWVKHMHVLYPDEREGGEGPVHWISSMKLKRRNRLWKIN